MADTDAVPLKIAGETAALAREQADERHMEVDEYLGLLVREDSAVDARARFMVGAREVLTDFGDVIDEALGEAAA